MAPDPTPDAAPSQATTQASTQQQVDELKVIVALLTEIVNRDSLPPGPVSTAETTTELVEASDTAFRYQLLSALMGATPATGLVATVIRARNGLDVTRPPGIVGGTHLSFVADGASYQFALTNDRVRAGDLQRAGVDDHGALESFVLRDGPHGPVVAIAPSLAAVFPSPTVV